ncbi:MAG: hypothetical protein JNN30_07790 [Rhodanobacteraceae bacterium]|nr:hypothetical protein [Rhodanobacteraceae bacterium]
MLKLHKLFLNDKNSESFDEVIAPSSVQRKVLVDAKNDIRDHLRRTIRAASVAILEMDRTIEPRFRTQGSWAYRTCVQPAHLPPQEIDWDFGVYLPVTVWNEQGPPIAMAKKYFDLVESALAGLCKGKKWTLDRSKSSCVRVRIASWAHIDIPLYAAPEEEFLQIAEKALAVATASGRFRESVYLGESKDEGELTEGAWDFLDDIHMATRSGVWVKSDPEDVSLWFTARVEQHGEQLRRVCRYLKAWRDYHWRDGGGPTSVSIMIAVAQSFTPAPRRDDIALEHGATILSKALRGDIREYGIDECKDDFNRLDAAQRVTAAELAKELANRLHMARQYGVHLIPDALRIVKAQFGPRISDDISFIELDSGAETVRQTPATAVVPPLVGATQAG